MKTFEGIYEKGKVRLNDSPELLESQTVYVLVPDADRQTGISPDRNRRIQDAKRAARARMRKAKATGNSQ